MTQTAAPTLGRFKKVIFATIGSLGDLHPFMALALELKKLGHDSVIATRETYRSKILDAGLGFAPVGSFEADGAEIARRVLDSKNGWEFAIRNLLLPDLRKSYCDLVEAAADADLMVASEVVFAAPLVAEKKKLPWASVILSPCSLFSSFYPSGLVPPWILANFRGTGAFVNRAIMNVRRSVTRNWFEPVRQLRAELHLSPSRHPLFDDKFSPYLNLALFSKVFARPEPDWPPQTLITGFVSYDGNKQGAEIPTLLRNFLNDGTPPIIFTLGSSAVGDPGAFYTESAAAARMLEKRAVLIVGKNSPPSNLSSDAIALDYIPYSQIFPRAAAVVHHGGVGTLAQTLHAGCPMLIVPHAFDQPDNAARASRLGVARVISRSDYRAERVALELKHLLLEDYGENARRIREIVRAEDGVRVACDALETNLLSSHH
jgi:rhamnosyltransferase subunit B